jgi:hypothetical protein
MRNAFVVFCDDIRAELAYKFSLMGVFGDTMVHFDDEAKRGKIERLCVFTRVLWDWNNQPKTAKLRIYGPRGTVQAESDIELGSKPDHPFAEPFNSVQIPIIIQNEEFDDGSQIRVTLSEDDGGEAEIGSLRLRIAKDLAQLDKAVEKK